MLKSLKIGDAYIEITKRPDKFIEVNIVQDHEDKYIEIYFSEREMKALIKLLHEIDDTPLGA